MSEQVVASLGDEAPRPVKRGDRNIRFLAQSVILEEAGSAGLVRFAMITITVVIFAFIGWAAVTNIDEVAVTSGEVVPTGQLQTIQHLQGGIVAEISVAEGQVVEKGEVLIRLDPADASVALDQMVTRRVGLELQAERLRALGTNRVPDFAFAGADFANLIANQTAVYDGQISASENRRSVLLAQIDQRRQDMELFERQNDTLIRNADLLLSELKLREVLYKKGLTTMIIYLDIKRLVNKAQGDIVNNGVEIKRARETMAESQRRLDELDTNAKEKALAEMGTVTSELAQINEAIVKLESRLHRLEIKAPVRGIVTGLQLHTVGGVVPAGAIIMELVPMDKELIIETRINPKDVGHVQIGQPVTVKITTYDFARYGGISGELVDVSASTFLDEQGLPYYKGIVSMDRGYVGFDPERNRVLPGMTAQADIKTGRKTLLQYLAKPVVNSVRSSFRER